MKNDKIHLVPQAVIDCVQGLANTKQDNLKLNYIMRLEAIREYCDYALKTTSDRNSFSNHNSNNSQRPNKGKYSRIGL